MTVFLKQYGEKRTGTNYIRALLSTNFSNVVCLMHVLGDKHSAPVAFDDIRRRSLGLPDEAWEFVTGATFAAPAETTRSNDSEQLKYIRNVAAGLLAEYDANRLGFVISIKNPYAWAASLAKYSGWLSSSQNRIHMNARFGAPLAAACDRFNARYRAWFMHHAQHEARSMILRHEDLIENSGMAAEALMAKFGLELISEKIVFPTGAMAPTHWDHSSPRMYPGKFDADFYRSGEYATWLDSRLWDIVQERIDWHVAAEFGYSSSRETLP
jgi:hypothetical protein